MQTETAQYSQQVIDIAKKYHKWVEWCEEDKCFIGQCPDLQIMCYYEDNPTNEIDTYNDMLDLIHEGIKVDIEEGVALPLLTKFSHLYAAQT